jgi:hypothetical protein
MLTWEAIVSSQSRLLAVFPVLVALACGGGGSDGPTGNNGNNNNGNVSGDGNVTMTVNGTAWRSLKAGDHVTRLNNNFYGIAASNVNYVLVLGIGNVTGPGTFSLDLATGNGSSAIVSNTAGGWGTAFTGGTGTITVTTLTANRIAGTFTFNAVPGSGSAAGTLQVRNGTFDLTF